MRKLVIVLLSVLLLLGLVSCEDYPSLGSGTAASQSNIENTAESEAPLPSNETEGETNSGVTWTPFV